MKRTYTLIAPLALVLFVGCGGGNDYTRPAPSPATGLSYTNPTAEPNEWKLVKDATSTSTHLVLNLMGPTDGTKYRGVGFTLQTDPTMVKFAQFKDAGGNPIGYYKDGGIFLDRNSAGTADIAPTLQTGGASGSKLMVGIFQKTDDTVWGATQGATAKDCSGIVLQVVIDSDATLKAMPGDVPLTVLKARTIPETGLAYISTRKTADITLNVGTLTLK